MPSERRVTRFRHNIAVAVTGLVAMITAMPLAGAAWYFSPLLLIGLAITIWGLRSGVDVDATGITVRALAGSRHLAWPEITGFTTTPRAVHAVLTNDRVVTLPAVTPNDVERLVAPSRSET